jgi:hypothetical protein
LVIESLVRELEKLQYATTAMHALPEDYRLLTERFRFSVTQRNQLKRLLQRWHVLEQTQVAEHLPIQDFKNAKQVLLGIETHLQAKVFVC